VLAHTKHCKYGMFINSWFSEQNLASLRGNLQPTRICHEFLYWCFTVYYNLHTKRTA